jgi:hypothetical protein
MSGVLTMISDADGLLTRASLADALGQKSLVGFATNSQQRSAGDLQAKSSFVGVPIVCFAAGTLIRSVHGEVAVEKLSAGDLVVVSSGETRPIEWLGHRTLNCRHHPEPRLSMPIRILASAFGPGKPSRDLYVSPWHAICVDVMGEVLIPASALVNGATVVQLDVDEVTYWHVELESHDILFANGLPAESYLEMGNRGFFAEECIVGLDALPDSTALTHADFCRPFFVDGPVVGAVRARLAAQAESLGWQKTHDMEVHLVVDEVRTDPDIASGLARFLLPATAKDVTLVSETFVPSNWGTTDTRSLGIAITSLHVADGLTCTRDIPIDDVALADGFHSDEAQSGASWRWTNGRLPIPSSFWTDCRTHVFLKIAFDPTAGQRWIAPENVLSINTSICSPTRHVEAA